MNIIANAESFAPGVNTIKLGALIRALEACQKNANVQFNFGGFTPRGFSSFRGDYNHLALSYGHGNVKVAELLDKAKACVGRDFTGYKGGMYKMSLDTPVWVDNPGDVTDTGLVMIAYEDNKEAEGGRVILYGELVEGI